LLVLGRHLLCSRLREKRSLALDGSRGLDLSEGGRRHGHRLHHRDLDGTGAEAHALNATLLTLTVVPRIAGEHVLHEILLNYFPDS
jgi:hypothetical protein